MKIKESFFDGWFQKVFRAQDLHTIPFYCAVWFIFDKNDGKVRLGFLFFFANFCSEFFRTKFAQFPLRLQKMFKPIETTHFWRLSLGLVWVVCYKGVKILWISNFDFGRLIKRVQNFFVSYVDGLYVYVKWCQGSSLFLVVTLFWVSQSVHLISAAATNFVRYIRSETNFGGDFASFG